jgi:hypothetical protein
MRMRSDSGRTIDCHQAMKPAVQSLTLIAILVLGASRAIHGQLFFQDFGQANEVIQVEPDPFDIKNRRTITGSEADLELLKRHSLATSTEALVEYFRKRTIADADRARAAAMVEQLGSPVFREREKAMDEILKIGAAALPFLPKGTKGADLELVRRAEICGNRIRSMEPPADVTAAAVRLLDARKPAELETGFLAYLPYASSDLVAEEIIAVLRKSASLGQPRPELIAALTDAMPIRRAAAAEALADVKGQTAAVKALLRDPEPLVRLRVARAFILKNDKDAVPVLIEALPMVPSSQSWMGEELLFRLAEGRAAPVVPRVGDEAARAKYKNSWLAWWAKNESQIDLAKLHDVPKLLGHTVVVLLDLNRVVELDAKNEIVWQINNLVFPLDVQVLPNGNVLVAEHKANRVTERDRFSGEIRWEKSVVGPLMAKRLSNRHTFVATVSQWLEFDENGDEVMSFGMPDGERLMKVNKMPGGDIVALTSSGRVVRMDEKGKVLSSFLIETSGLSGGRIDVLPNGHVLVPGENKVIEYDTQGEIVWEMAAPEPVAATRLPNGNTLVTTFSPQTGAIEFDRHGHETGWSFRQPKSFTRVTRALRR